MVFNEKKGSWIKDLTAFRVGDKKVWLNDVDRVIKVSQTDVVPQPNDENQISISKIFRRLAPFDSRLHPNVLLTAVLSPNDPR